ncbi:MAG: PDZ domain-containing protein [Verrucomicrobia bacterium]|nr:PDZ domain-containing protein [Verrucomicrobiota bacterium]
MESLVPNGPAERSKRIKPKDRIIAVKQADGEAIDVVDMKLNKVVEMIRGPKGTEVTLTIIPADAADSSERRTVTLVRDEIKLEDQEAKAKLYEMPQPDAAPCDWASSTCPPFTPASIWVLRRANPNPAAPPTTWRS